MLKVLAERQVPIPDHVDIFFLSGYVVLRFPPFTEYPLPPNPSHLDSEVDATDKSALDVVLEKAAAEIIRLEKEAEKVLPFCPCVVSSLCYPSLYFSLVSFPDFRRSPVRR